MVRPDAKIRTAGVQIVLAKATKRVDSRGNHRDDGDDDSDYQRMPDKPKGARACGWAGVHTLRIDRCCAQSARCFPLAGMTARGAKRSSYDYGATGQC